MEAAGRSPSLLGGRWAEFQCLQPASPKAACVALRNRSGQLAALRNPAMQGWTPGMRVELVTVDADQTAGFKRSTLPGNIEASRSSALSRPGLTAPHHARRRTIEPAFDRSLRTCAARRRSRRRRQSQNRVGRGQDTANRTRPAVDHRITMSARKSIAGRKRMPSTCPVWLYGSSEGREKMMSKNPTTAIAAP